LSLFGGVYVFSKKKKGEKERRREIMSTEIERKANLLGSF
jgi:hypothetical protein